MLTCRTAYPLAQAAADAASKTIPVELAHDPAFCWVKWSYVDLIYFENVLKEEISWGCSADQIEYRQRFIHEYKLVLYNNLAKYFAAKLTQGAPAPVPTFIISAASFAPA